MQHTRRPEDPLPKTLREPRKRGRGAGGAGAPCGIIAAHRATDRQASRRAGMRRGDLRWGLGLVLGLAGGLGLAGIIGTAPAGSRAAPPAPPAFTFAAPINA